LGNFVSAKGYTDLIDILKCAQKAVLFPIAPLFDLLNYSLTPEFDKALKRSFRILDRDNDGYLNDEELVEYVADVFGYKMSQFEFWAFKRKIKWECEELKFECEDAGIVYDEAEA
jgi:hypothetical protein